MTAMLVRKSFCVLILASLVAGTPLVGADFFPEETSFRATFDSSRIALKGRVVDSSGAALAGCTVRLQSGEQALTAPDGTFTLPGFRAATNS